MHSCRLPESTSSGVALQDANMPLGRPSAAFIAVFRAAQSASIRRPARVAAANHWSGPCRWLAADPLSASAPNGDRSAREKISWDSLANAADPKDDHVSW